MTWLEAAHVFDKLRAGYGWFIKKSHREAASAALAERTRLNRALEDNRKENSQLKQKADDAVAQLKVAVDRYNRYVNEFNEGQLTAAQQLNSNLQTKLHETQVAYKNKEEELTKAHNTAEAAWNKMCDDYEKLERTHKEVLDKVSGQEAFIASLGEELERQRQLNEQLTKENQELAARTVTAEGKQEEVRENIKTIATQLTNLC